MKDMSEEKEWPEDCLECQIKDDEIKSLESRLKEAKEELRISQEAVEALLSRKDKLEKELLRIDLDMRMTDIAEWWGNGHGKKVRNLL